MYCLCFIFDLSTMAQEQKSLKPLTSLELVEVAARPMSLKTSSDRNIPSWGEKEQQHTNQVDVMRDENTSLYGEREQQHSNQVKYIKDVETSPGGGR